MVYQKRNRIGLLKGGLHTPKQKGLDEVFETLMITIAFASVIVAVLSFKQK